MTIQMRRWVEANMSPVERMIVVLASFASKLEIHRLKLFFQQWEKDNE